MVDLNRILVFAILKDNDLLSVRVGYALQLWLLNLTQKWDG